MSTESENVFNYFGRKIGIDPKDPTLRELSCDSNCGRDCVKAIDAAALFIPAVVMAFGDFSDHRDNVLRALNNTVECYWHG